MKNVKVLALLLITAFAMTACNNTEKILAKKDGKWAVKSQSDKYYTDGVLDSEEVTTTGLGFVVFESDGTGEFQTDAGATDGTFNWSYSDDKVTLTEGGLGLVYDVLESSKDEQKWSTSIEIEFAGTVSRTDSELMLERAD